MNVHSFTTEKNFTYIVRENVKNYADVKLHEVRRIVLLLLKKPELRPYFHRYADGYSGRDMEEVMTYEEWSRFLEEVQNSKMDKRYYTEMLAQLKNPQSVLGYPRTNNSSLLSLMEFSNIIFSTFNLAMDPQMDHTFQEMDKPLTDYFINSLHNTYQGENSQLTGSNSCMPYYEAIKIGCRCVELETWNGTKGEPVVASIRNLGSMLMFEDVIRCIHKWAFKFSEYPFFIFIENHCETEQMIKMKKILNKYLGESIYRVSEKEFLNDKFPSPAKLKKKVALDQSVRDKNKECLLTQEVQR